MHIADNPHRHRGRVVDNGHCVRLVQVAVPDLGHTSTWRRGVKVRGAEVPSGTIIATFNASGRYENDTTGRSHAAIYLSQNQTGLSVLDQWVGRAVGERVIRFKGGAGLPVDDGDAYHVVLT